MTGAQQLLCNFMIARQPLHLIKRSLVVIQPQPGHAVKYRLRGLLRGTFQIGILDAKNEFTGMPAGISPGKQRGARAANVKVTSGTGSEAGADQEVRSGCKAELEYLW